MDYVQVGLVLLGFELDLSLMLCYSSFQDPVLLFSDELLCPVDLTVTLYIDVLDHT